MPAQPVNVLKVDPDLGSTLTAERRDAALAALTAAPVRLEIGEWDGTPLSGAGLGHLGLLVMHGFLAREVLLHGQVCTELLGPGDLVRPWADAEPALPPVEVRWNVLSSSRLVLLDRRFATRVREFPEVSAALFARLHRAQRLAAGQAISQLTNVERRLIALLWQVAGRWGVVTGDGIVVALTFSHRLLSQMIGARRPTVSTAIGRLVAREELIRRDDGTWLLPSHGPPATASRPQRVVPARRKLFQVDFAPEPAGRASSAMATAAPGAT
jgi:hypothetical protein